MSEHTDLGALVSDDTADENTGETEVSSVQIDTSEPATYEITYRAEDGNGNETEATRTVIVYDDTAGEEETATTTPQTITETASSTTDTATPSPDSSAQGSESPKEATADTAGTTQPSRQRLRRARQQRHRQPKPHPARRIRHQQPTEQ